MPGLKSSPPIAVVRSGLVQAIALSIDRALDRLYAACGAIAAIAIVLIAFLVATSIITRLIGVYIGGLTEGAGYAMAAAGSSRYLTHPPPALLLARLVERVVPSGSKRFAPVGAWSYLGSFFRKL